MLESKALLSSNFFHLMPRTIERTPLSGRKVGEISVVPDPRAACHVRGQYLELVSESEMGVTGHRGRVACTYAKLQEGWYQGEVDVPTVSHPS